MTTLDLKQIQINSVIELFSQGKISQALEVVQDLFKDYPNEPILFNISGACHAGLGQLDAAVKSYEEAIAIKPDYAKAHFNLAGTLHDLGQLDAAIISYEKTIEIKSDFAEAHNNLGNVFKELQQDDAAIQSYKKALVINPEYVESQYSLGNIFQELGQFESAIKCYEKVLVIKPNFAEMHNNLGVVFQKAGKLNAALERFQKALVIKPDFAEAHNNLGNVFKELQQDDAAIQSYKKALVINPEYVESQYSLGNIFQELGQFESAIKCYEKVLVIKPNFAEAYNNLGNAFNKLLQKDEAIKFYEKAIVIKSDYAGAYVNLASTLKDLKRLEEALVIYESEIIQNSDLDFILGELLHTRMHLCIWDDLPNKLNELRKKINNSEKVLNPFVLLALIDDPELQRRQAEIYAIDLSSINNKLPRVNCYSRHKKIRIGYFSADFRDHPVAYLTAELYELHDRSKFEIYAFSFGPDTKDKMNLRIQTGVDYFHDVYNKSDKDIAMLSRSIEIDIAIDLGGYTADSRSGIFAMSPAPIQVSYIGYLGTLGVNYYDYIIADQTIIPEKNQKYYSEKIAYLPSYQVNDSKEEIPDTIFTRSDLGLPEVGFVFCCFNNTFKITPTTFDSWSRILLEAEGSVLLIYADNDTAKINLTKEIVARGIHSERLIFGERLSKLEYMARYKAADLFLDTHPYNAGTTASDALRMGLPVLTCLGNSFASRMAASLLKAVNLPELVKVTQEEYETCAIELACDPEKFKIIKNKLVDNLPKAALYDTPLFTRRLESVYNEMYERHHDGLEPDHIYV
ncbi:tetratricopeptide repeat protein [Candidatus Thioglobus sp.]|nr:tetratricopeptide repeat protein [Candidatus Thioglobus sp.]